MLWYSLESGNPGSALFASYLLRLSRLKCVGIAPDRGLFQMKYIHIFFYFSKKQKKTCEYSLEVPSRGTLL